MDQLSELALFVRVVEAGSFSAAADRLGVTRAMISKAVARLEDELGARLLQRTTRRLTLTEAGAVLFESAARALSDIEAAREAVAQLQDAPRGTLRISAPVHFGAAHLAPVLTELMRRYPDVSLDVQLDNRFVDIVEEGFDLAIRIADLSQSLLVGRRLAACPLVVCASPAYWAQHGVPAHPSALSDHQCFVYRNHAATAMWRFRAADGASIAVPITGRLRYDHDAIARMAAIDGLGVIRLPKMYVEDDLREGRLVAALNDFQAEAEAAIYAVYPSRAHLPPKVRVLIDLLVEHFAGGCRINDGVRRRKTKAASRRPSLER